MGMVRIEMWGSFPTKSFDTCAEEGGHVMALKRGIDFLSKQLGEAVILDVQLKGVVPPAAPLGQSCKV